MQQEIELLRQKNFIRTNARLFWEWEIIDNRLKNHKEISYQVLERNIEGIPIIYKVTYHIRSFCGVLEKDSNGLEKPIYADTFFLKISIPNNYPSVESKLDFKFMTMDEKSNKIPHPWHPNIRYFGDFAGKVCLNTLAFGTYTDLAVYIERIAMYLKYEKYHALNESPYPEDYIVAEWVLKQAETNGWIEELKKQN